MQLGTQLLVAPTFHRLQPRAELGHQPRIRDRAIRDLRQTLAELLQPRPHVLVGATFELLRAPSQALNLGGQRWHLAGKLAEATRAFGAGLVDACQRRLQFGLCRGERLSQRVQPSGQLVTERRGVSSFKVCEARLQRVHPLGLGRVEQPGRPRLVACPAQAPVPGHRLGWAQLLQARPLVRERAGQLEARDRPARDKDLAEPIAGRTLLLERVGKLLLGDHPLLDEDLADRPAVFLVDGRDVPLSRRRSKSVDRLLSRIRALEVRPLLCDRTGQLQTRHPVVVDEDLAEKAAFLFLDGQRFVEGFLGDEPTLDEDRPDQLGGNGGRFHAGLIGIPSDEV